MPASAVRRNQLARRILLAHAGAGFHYSWGWPVLWVVHKNLVHEVVWADGMYWYAAELTGHYVPKLKPAASPTELRDMCIEAFRSAQNRA